MTLPPLCRACRARKLNPESSILEIADFLRSAESYACEDNV